MKNTIVFEGQILKEKVSFIFKMIYQWCFETEFYLQYKSKAYMFSLKIHKHSKIYVYIIGKIA